MRTNDILQESNQINRGTPKTGMPEYRFETAYAASAFIKLQPSLPLEFDAETPVPLNDGTAAPALLHS
ncbi:hypothetical protein DACRYDRAFT_21896 [Dacryopinax primogenitus]|uniref:Uncharacterized protein n=1 Tax=Dacryopinax primogenitus (strain DJM 731) TaxID=1858805 RepID=M5G1N9_DACPD|nr:uncharacterized protein DACRYDRAFT_21896 [Dacryopinax primogenitus]EJU02130.1 hypothetical protein DACRYDRAFT_21896 [Dacryopinax primogenitus]